MRYIHLNTRAAYMVPAAFVVLSGMPAQASESDSRIEDSAKNSYNFKTYLKDDHVNVKSSGGVVTLTGTVSQPYQKALAEDTVAGLPGVSSVSNQLTVIGEQPAERSDAWITMKVKTVLAFHKNVSAMDTEVNTDKGVVTLTGKVESEAQKQLTGEYAKDVEGVTSVRNDLKVLKPEKSASATLGENVDDTSITAQVKTTLLFHKSTHALATKVVTRKGVVTLRGEARNGAEKELVTKLTEDIKGVKRVNNRMTVKPS